MPPLDTRPANSTPSHFQQGMEPSPDIGAVGAPASILLRQYGRPSDALLTWLQGDYGGDPAFLQDRCQAVCRALKRYLELFGDTGVSLFRAPARISLNPHCDHQGAWVPYGCHGREIILVCSPATDAAVSIGNTDPSFQEVLEFRPAEEIGREPEAWQCGWLEYIESPGIRQTVQETVDEGHPSRGRTGALNYVRAAWLRHLRHREEVGANDAEAAVGMRMVLSGDIPQGGGLSSSSAVVVSVFQALVTRAGDRLSPQRMAELCGEAEWYVGTRGGSGDHAAMLLGERDALTHIRFRAPLGVREWKRSAFPKEYALLLAHSQVRSEKSAAQRLLFNRGIFAYRFAFLALRAELDCLAEECGIPAEIVQGTESLGDLNHERFEPRTLYRLLARIPETVTCRWLADRYPQQFASAAMSCLGTDDLAKLPNEIPLRGAALYGLGRSDRGLKMPALLDDGSQAAMTRFGRWMSITHDGDRVVETNAGGEHPYRAAAEDQRNESLANWERACSEADARAELAERPGCYGASVPQLDRLVDVLQGCPGVLGAGLMGAGGGGYALALVRRNQVEAVGRSLNSDFYQPLGLEPAVETWRSTAAAGALPVAALGQTRDAPPLAEMMAD